ncbi:MAG: DNA glycosylase [Oceanipulchritudo sp.]
MKSRKWESLCPAHPFHEHTLAETLLGGQAFRWFPDAEPRSWTGIWDRHVVRLRLAPDGGLQYRSLTPTTPEEILHYLGIDRLEGLARDLPCQSDPALDRLRAKWEGISLLRQPPGETLVAFICSSNKRIPQIRAMLRQLSEHFGKPIPGTPYHRLPTWPELAAVPESGLRSCALGYRAAHVAATATFLRQNPDHLKKIRGLSLADARKALQALPGVGPKVADCVLLFGFGRTEAFPVDTWIAKLMVRHYPDLAGWKRERIATFARLHFGRAAGLAQQWIFAEKGVPMIPVKQVRPCRAPIRKPGGSPSTGP